MFSLPKTTKNSIKKRVKTLYFHIQTLFFLKISEEYSPKDIEKRTIFILFSTCSPNFEVNNLTNSLFQEML